MSLRKGELAKGSDYRSELFYRVAEKNEQTRLDLTTFDRVGANLDDLSTFAGSALVGTDYDDKCDRFSAQFLLSNRSEATRTLRS